MRGEWELVTYHDPITGKVHAYQVSRIGSIIRQALGWLILAAVVWWWAS